MNKYQVNQLVFCGQIVVFVLVLLLSNWLFKDFNHLSFQFLLVWTLVFFFTFILSTCNLHYFSNLIHLGSHNLLSKNCKINNILGWISSLSILPFTFIDFKITHLEHHKHQGDNDLDPDYKIVKTGSVWLLPLRIVVYKDYFFWKLALQKHKYNWLVEYCLQRLVQIYIICYIANWTNTQDFRYVALFILPLIAVGIMNSAYLYFYPHYTNGFEGSLRKLLITKSTQKTLNLLSLITVLITTIIAKPLAKLFIWGIDISRVIHEKHHQRPSGNLFYYPEWWIYKPKNLS